MLTDSKRRAYSAQLWQLENRQQLDLNACKALVKMWSLVSKTQGKARLCYKRQPVKGFSPAGEVISCPAHRPAAALLLHCQQEEERATIHRFPLLPDGGGMAASRNNRMAVSGYHTLRGLRGWKSHKAAVPPHGAFLNQTWCQILPPRWWGCLLFVATSKELGNKTHISLLVVNPSSPGKNGFIFLPLVLVKVLFYSNVQTIPAVLLSWGLWEAQSSQQHCHNLNWAWRGLWASRQKLLRLFLPL